MSYSVNGKVYTDNALMDEIVYNTKIILSGIVVKNEILALEYETETSLENADNYRLAKESIYPFDQFPFTYEMLASYGFTPAEVLEYLNDRYAIPEDIRDPLMDYCQKYYVKDFETNDGEINKYYRSLMGLPEYGTIEYDLYIDPSWIPTNYNQEANPIDFDIPIHKQPADVIDLLYQIGKIDELIQQYRSFNYSYLRYLGGKAINLYTARMANRWDILYIPTVNSLVQSRFQELYNINKEMFNRRFYQDAYNASGTNYYDEVTIVMLLAQTFADIVTDVPEWYITRDIFDIRSVQYFLESYGVPYFSEIPLKYQIRIVKNLNKLIMDKSTDVCNQDILDLLELNDAVVYKYFLYKQRRTDNNHQYITDGELEDQYNLKFIQVKQGDTYDNYIKLASYLANYDEVTEKDPYWDGVDEHDTVKHKILEKDFTIEPSKYIAIETNVDYGEYMKEIKYLMGLILDSRFEETFTIPVSAISEGGTYRLSDLFLLLSMLTGAYAATTEEDLAQINKVLEPKDLNEQGANGERPRPEKEYHEIDMNDDTLYWMTQRHGEYFTSDEERYYGFNASANLTEINETLARNFAGSSLEGGTYVDEKGEIHKYTLDDFGAGGFYLPNQYTDESGALRCKINTVDELLRTYTDNIRIYDSLTNYIHYKVKDKDEYEAAQYVFEQLFTKQFDYGAYRGASNLVDVLEARSYTLAQFYKQVIKEPEIETRRENIKAILSNIISTLEYYVKTDKYKYLYSFTPLSSFASLLKYAYLLINVFKSYKIHLIDSNVAYDVNSIEDTHETGYDTIMKKTLENNYRDRHNVYDCFMTIIHIYLKDYPPERNSMREYVHIRTPLIYPDDEEFDLDGGRANSTNYESYDGGKANTGIPYSSVNGGTAYLTRNDYWDINGLDIKGERSQHATDPIDLDGGNIMDVDQEWNIRNTYSSNFIHDVDGGAARTDLIIDDSYFIRVADKQTEVEVKIADFQGLDYSEDKEAREITLTESWRKWSTVTDFLEDYNNLSLYHLNKLKNEVRKIKLVDVHRKYEPGVEDIPDKPAETTNVDIPESIVIEY